MKKIIASAIIFAIIFAIISSCSLDPYGDGLGKNSTGGDDYESCKPQAVSEVWTVNKSANSITFAWNKAKGAKSYNIYRNNQFIKTTADTSFEDSKIGDEQTYKYRITSVNDCGENIQSAFYSECTKPIAPTRIFFTMKTNNYLEISWNNDFSSHYKNYSFNIYRSNEVSGKYSLIGTSYSSPFTDSILDDTNVFYKVTKVFIYGCGDENESEMSEVAACMSMSKPSVTTEALSSSSVKISWEKVDGATSYDIYYAADSTITYYTRIGYTSNTFYTDNLRLNPSTTYYYKVTAINNCREITSDYVSVKTLIGAPTEVTAEAISMSNIKISWKANSEAINYDIYRNLEASGEYDSVGSSADALFIDEALLPNTRYFYKVSATDGDGRKSALSALSFDAVATTKNCADAPAKPNGLSAEPLSPTSIKISWDEAYRASSYEIYASTSETGNFSRAAAVQNSLDYTDIQLTSETKYYYKIIAINDCGKSDTSDIVFATTQVCVPPSAPQNGSVSAETLTSSKIKIYWVKIDDAQSYNVYRAASETAAYSRIGNTDNTEFTDSSGLLPARTYYYKITAAIDCGESEKSDSAFATTLSCLPPPAPTNVSVSLLIETSINIYWDNVTGANIYEIYRASSRTNEFTSIGFTSSPGSITDRFLFPSTTYFYKVRSISNCGTGEFSEIVSITTPDCGTPSMVREISASAESSNSIKISWNSASGAKIYNVYYSKTAEGEYILIASVSAQYLTSFIDTGLSAATTYYYKVSAANDCAEGRISGYVSATTQSQ
ncbi:MAG: hypothetical protein FWF51_05180 [Chitinivibrionia bacterium]|nr:hypothetical protein [Chitinivibrionia bacterium]